MAVLDPYLDGRGGYFSVTSPRIENGEITGVRFGLQNESARLNLAVLPEWDEESPGTAREALMALPGMTESTADAMLDWIDTDGEPRQFGAESDYYMGLGLPYGPRNTLPTSLEELLLVRDVSRELLFGADANFNHRLDADELRGGRSAFSRGTAGAGLPWASLLTVFSAERNLNPEGELRIDLNTLDLEALYDELGRIDAFDQEWIDFIIAYRQFGPYDGTAEVLDDDAEPARVKEKSGKAKKLSKLFQEKRIGRPGRDRSLAAGRIRVPHGARPWSACGFASSRRTIRVGRQRSKAPGSTTGRRCATICRGCSTGRRWTTPRCCGAGST